MARITQIPITVDFPANAPPCCCGTVGCDCGDLPETMYARVYQRQFTEPDGYPMEWAWFDVTLNEGAHDIAGVCQNDSSKRQWFGTYSIRWLGGYNPGDTYVMTQLLRFTCNPISGRLLLGVCHAWRLLETLPATYKWEVVSNQNIHEFIDCDDIDPLNESWDFVENAITGWLWKIEIKDTPF